MIVFQNKILYATHAVCCDPCVATPAYMEEMAAALSPDGDADTHCRELEAMNNDGSWLVEPRQPAGTPVAPFTFPSLDAIRGYVFAGNYHSDSAAFTAIEAYAVANPGEAQAALSVMTAKGMGLGDVEDEEFQEWCRENGCDAPSSIT